MSSARDVMKRMKELQERREAAFAPLASVMEQRESVRGEIARLLKEQEQRLAELDGPYRSAFSGALTGGWSAEELTALGAEEPARRGRPKASRNRPKKASSTLPGDGPTGPATAEIPAQADAEDSEAKVEPETVSA
ncbi:hypothetical protein [Streptomyces sp. CA-146814]|uniref:hypothetical protein n=1 Tax=Streptomyces sp. CA-146814 TaxID=3240053 RepID=UPI003D8FB583